MLGSRVSSFNLPCYLLSDWAKTFLRILEGENGPLLARSPDAHLWGSTMGSASLGRVIKVPVLPEQTLLEHYLRCISTNLFSQSVQNSFFFGSPAAQSKQKPKGSSLSMQNKHNSFWTSWARRKWGQKNEWDPSYSKSSCALPSLNASVCLVSECGDTSHPLSSCPD